MNESARHLAPVPQPSSPASNEIEVLCPSGLAGRIRGLIGRDYRNFNRQDAKSGVGVSKILNACWTATTEPGIYKINGRLDWDDALVGDRLYGLMAIRRAMYPGEDYSFKISCKEPQCREPIDWGLDLEELPVKPLPPESAKALQEGRNLFAIDTAVGQIWFKLQNGRDQVQAHRVIQQAVRRGDRRNKPSEIVYALATRVLKADDLPEGADFDAKVEWLEGLSAPLHREMLRGFDRADCGVDTTIEIECPSCYATQEIELPFDASLLFPK